MKTKKTHIIFTLLALLFLITACLSSSTLRELNLTPGIYEGSAMGLRGPITVLLELSSGEIVDIEIIEYRESVHPGLAAMEELLEMVLETGSTDIDVISGATFSSRGFLEAVENALEKAFSNKVSN